MDSSKRGGNAIFLSPCLPGCLAQCSAHTQEILVDRLRKHVDGYPINGEHTLGMEEGGLSGERVKLSVRERWRVSEKQNHFLDAGRRPCSKGP